MADERITANEWNKRKACPICIDIADKAIPMDGEIMKVVDGVRGLEKIGAITKMGP